jgi:hypothetical protein
MVGHNAPSEEAIASCGTAILAVPLRVLAVTPHGRDARATPGLKVLKGAGHNCCNVISPHPTLARPCVEVRFDFL